MLFSYFELGSMATLSPAWPSTFSSNFSTCLSSAVPFSCFSIWNTSCDSTVAASSGCHLLADSLSWLSASCSPPEITSSFLPLLFPDFFWRPTTLEIFWVTSPESLLSCLPALTASLTSGSFPVFRFCPEVSTSSNSFLLSLFSLFL